MSPRLVDLARLALGVVAIVEPDSLLLPGNDPRSGSGKDRTVVRLLGARYIVQSTVSVRLSRPWVPALEAAIDLTHAATMLALAAVDRQHRRLALRSAVVAIAFAAADLRERQVARA